MGAKWVFQSASDFLDQVKKKHGLTSDYQLAKFLGWNQQRITKIRGGASFDDDASAQIADILSIDAGYVAACMSAQRAQSDLARKMWEKAAATLAGSTIAGLLVGCTVIAAGPGALDITHTFAQSAAQVADLNIHYTQCKNALGAILAACLAWTSICSARSR
jgi:hypothetical protein